MPDKPLNASTHGLVEREHDTERWARVGAKRESMPPIGPNAPSDPAESAEVGLTQKGTDEDAIVKREAEV